MKFGKRLQSQLEETLPEWRDKYLSYKQLKKRLKLISPAESPAGEDLSALQDLSTRQPCQAQSPDVVSEHALPEASLTVVGSPDPSANGAEAATEHVGRNLSSGSAVIDPLFLQSIGATDTRTMTAEELDFIHFLNAELEKFNTFFIEKEEEYVIRLQEMKERIERLQESGGHGELAPSESLNEEVIEIRKDIVNFHGEMVLLENYSSLNYTGLVKILKKHDKRTGALLRMPFIQNVLRQPFFTTELLSKLVQECENNLQSLFPSSSGAVVSQVSNSEQYSRSADKALGGIPFVEERNYSAICDEVSGKAVISAEAEAESFLHGDVEIIYRSTIAALRTFKDLRRGSSTYSAFSLPPLSQDGAGDSSPCCATLPVCAKH